MSVKSDDLPQLASMIVVLMQLSSAQPRQSKMLSRLTLQWH
jgi:hypothetical protein